LHIKQLRIQFDLISFTSSDTVIRSHISMNAHIGRAFTYISHMF